MSSNLPLPDYLDKDVIVFCKHSRLDHVRQTGTVEELRLLNFNDPLSKDLKRSHDNNLRCIEAVASALTSLGKNYEILYRSQPNKLRLADKLVISVGGDGTLLEASHFCENSPILGVNSDVNSSIGALCVANASTIKDVLAKIYQNQLKPSPLSRLAVDLDTKENLPLALNDILFCNKNPASMSRFTLSLGKRCESLRGSGLWVATAAGSTGAIYGSGAVPLPLLSDYAIFRSREPYWSNEEWPQLLKGTIKKDEVLVIQSTMTDGAIFIDGPHETRAISLGESVQIRLAKNPLWLFNGPSLINDRELIIKRRAFIRTIFACDGEKLC